MHGDGRTLVQKTHTSEPENLVAKTLYIKERYNVSNTAYYELAMVNSSLPRSYAITKAAKELDTMSLFVQLQAKCMECNNHLLNVS